MTAIVNFEIYIFTQIIEEQEINVVIGSSLTYTGSVINGANSEIILVKTVFGDPINLTEDNNKILQSDEIHSFTKAYIYLSPGTYSDLNVCFYTIENGIESCSVQIIFPLIVNVYQFPEISFTVTGFVNNIEFFPNAIINVGTNITWKYKIVNLSNIFDVEINLDNENINLLKGETYEKTANDIAQIGNVFKESGITVTVTSINRLFFQYNSYFGANPQITSTLALKSKCDDEPYFPQPGDTFLYGVPGTYLLTISNTGNVGSLTISTVNGNTFQLAVGESKTIEIFYSSLSSIYSIYIEAIYVDEFGNTTDLSQIVSIETPEDLGMFITGEVNTLLYPDQTTVDYTLIINTHGTNLNSILSFLLSNGQIFPDLIIIPPVQEIIKKHFNWNIDSDIIFLTININSTDIICSNKVTNLVLEYNFRRGKYINVNILTNKECVNDLWLINLYENDILVENNEMLCTSNFNNFLIDPEKSYKIVQKNISSSYNYSWKLNDNIIHPTKIENDLVYHLSIIEKSTYNFVINMTSVNFTFKNFVGISQSNFISSNEKILYRDQILFTNKNNIKAEEIFYTQVRNPNIQ